MTALFSQNCKIVSVEPTGMMMEPSNSSRILEPSRIELTSKRDKNEPIDLTIEAFGRFVPPLTSSEFSNATLRKECKEFLTEIILNRMSGPSVSGKRTDERPRTEIMSSFFWKETNAQMSILQKSNPKHLFQVDLGSPSGRPRFLREEQVRQLLREIKAELFAVGESPSGEKSIPKATRWQNFRAQVSIFRKKFS